MGFRPQDLFFIFLKITAIMAVIGGFRTEDFLEINIVFRVVIIACCGVPPNSASFISVSLSQVKKGWEALI